MSEGYHSNKQVESQQGDTVICLDRFSSAELECLTDLLFWTRQPETSETSVMIVHFWLTLADRLTDKEYVHFCEAWDIGLGD